MSCCRICQSQTGSVHYAKERLIGLSEEFRYFHCRKCGCLQLDQEVENLEKFYGSGYGTIHASAVKQMLRTVMYYFSSSPIELLAKTMAVFTPGCNYGLMRVLRKLPKDIDILDVGCGSGRLLHGLRSLGFTGRLIGVDAFLERNQTFDNHVEIRKADLTSFADAKGFDLISLMHTFEHVAKQEESLNAIKRLLKPGGLCVISIPIVGSEQWHRFGTQWVQMDPPRHFFLHTPDSFRILAERSGMKVSHTIRESSAFQFWGTALVRKGVPIIPISKSYIRSLWRIPLDMARAAWADHKGTGDTATFVLARQ